MDLTREIHFDLCFLEEGKVWMKGWRKPAGPGLSISPSWCFFRCPYGVWRTHTSFYRSHGHWGQNPPWPTDSWLLHGFLEKHEKSFLLFLILSGSYFSLPFSSSLLHSTLFLHTCSCQLTILLRDEVGRAYLNPLRETTSVRLTINW